MDDVILAKSRSPIVTDAARSEPRRHEGGHDRHGHVHVEHAHAHPPSVGTAPRLSLLRLSALSRLAGVAVLLALLWAAVLWALTPL